MKPNTREKLKGLMWICLFISAIACGDSKDDNDENTGSENDGDAGIDNTGTDTDDSVCPYDPSLAEGDADELFGWPNIPVFDIYLPPDRWEQLQKEARAEQYVEAEACFEGRGIGKVGIRFKGASGSLYNCFNEKDENICRKLGIKLKFSEYDKEGRFFGMKRLNFQGNRYDNSYMKEKLSYDLYQAMDIISPRASWAELRVNDEAQGLFGMVEQIDGRFTADRWKNDGDGNLYKEVWPTTATEDWSIATDKEEITSHLKTNDEEPDVSKFMGFSKAMLAADDADLETTLGGYMDLDYLARYMAVDDAIANFDGITTYYIDVESDWRGNHNFYLYEEAADAYTLIPWDLESTFSISGFGPVPHWTTTPEDCSLIYHAWSADSLKVIAPGCDLIFKAVARDLTEYRKAGKRLLENAFSEESITESIDAHTAFIRDAAEADPNGPGLTDFLNAAASLKNQVPLLRKRLEYLLAGKTWVPLQVQFDDVTDFETQDDLGLIMGPGIHINATSTASFSINTETPLDGEGSLVIDFEFADGEGPWEQWLNYIVPLAGGVYDVSDMTGIRMTLRADETRTLRLELDSPYVSSADGWLRMGWDISMEKEATEVEVIFQDADIPFWASNPASTLEDVLTAISGLSFGPQCNGRADTGYLPEGTTDEGFLEVDNIVFF